MENLVRSFRKKSLVRDYTPLSRNSQPVLSYALHSKKSESFRPQEQRATPKSFRTGKTGKKEHKEKDKQKW